jgi:hypothetical protein
MLKGSARGERRGNEYQAYGTLYALLPFRD